MKRYVTFTILSVFCLSLTSCDWMQKKEQPQKKQEQEQKQKNKSAPSHRRYHSNLNV